MNNIHIITTNEGIMCRYCHKEFKQWKEADVHIKQLIATHMLQYHIAIHWNQTTW